MTLTQFKRDVLKQKIYSHLVISNKYLPKGTNTFNSAITFSGFKQLDTNFFYHKANVSLRKNNKMIKYGYIDVYFYFKNIYNNKNYRQYRNIVIKSLEFYHK